MIEMQDTKPLIKEGVRLIFVNMDLVKGDNSSTIETTYSVFNPFKLPKGMSLNEALYVISYLRTQAFETFGYDKNSYDNANKINSLLEEYDFKKLKGYNVGYSRLNLPIPPQSKLISLSGTEQIDGIADLFFVTGNIKCFKQTELYSRFFRWFRPTTSSQEVSKIYACVKNRNSNCFGNYEK